MSPLARAAAPRRRGDGRWLASLGNADHLGKRCFAFSSLDKSNIPDILAKI